MRDQHQILRTDKIAGYYILDDPTGGPTRDGCEDGYLHVEKLDNGQWYDTELDAVIEAREIQVVDAPLETWSVPDGPPFDAPTEISVIIEDDQYRVFVPNPGECERVGMPIKRLTH